MKYPSILYLSERQDNEVTDDVLDDLKITSLVSDEASQVMKYPCGKADIAARQQTFGELTANGTEALGTLAALYDAVSDTAVKDGLFRQAGSEEIRCAVFTALMNSFCSLVIKISGCSFTSALLSRFVGAFSDIASGKEFSELLGDITSVYPILNRIDNVSYRVLGESLELLPGKNESYDAKLYRCASSLGLSIPEPVKAEPRRVSPAIISGYAKIYPDEFALLKAFTEKYEALYDRTVIDYKREIGFYLSLCSLLSRAADSGVTISYPTVSEIRQYKATDAYDISLLLKNERYIVPNDIMLSAEEPFFFLTGANGGGKTTYLRAVGINLLLFLNGCPVAAKSAEIYPFTCLFTHFPRDERFENTGRFLDEEIRVKAILERADENSLILLNETYSTTAQELSTERTVWLAEKLNGDGRFGIYITHQHAISKTGIPMLSVIIDADDNNRRTYRIALHGTAKRSFADDILKKYSLTKEKLEERFGVKL